MMKGSKMKNPGFMATLLIVSFLFTACAKHNSHTSGTAGGSDEYNRYDEPLFDEDTGQYETTYRFKANGCDTGTHTFRSNSASDTQDQFCKALLDDALNKGCARDQRRDRYNKTCSVETSQPIEVSPNTPVTPVPSTPEAPPPPSAPWPYEVKSSLNHGVVDSYEIGKGLNQTQTEAAKRISEDMRFCGLSAIGPQCLESNGGFEMSAEVQAIGERLFYVSTLLAGSYGDELLFVFDLQTKPSITSSGLRVYAKLKGQGGRALAEFLADKTAVLLMSTLKIRTKDIAVTEGLRLQNPKNLKEIYHTATYLMRFDSADTKVPALIKKSILQNKNWIVESDSTPYPNAVFSLFKNNSPSNQELTELAEELLKSKSETLVITAATTLLVIDPTRADLKALVLQGLESKSSNIRYQAIAALAQTKLTKAEQNRIIERVGDKDYDVARLAFNTSAQFNLSDDQVSVIEKLFDSSISTNRFYAVDLMAKISSDAATIALIGRLGDKDYDVAREADSVLQSRTLRSNHLGALNEIMENGNSTARFRIVDLLAKIMTDEASNILIGALGDRDYDVAREANTQLQRRKLGESNIEALSLLLKEGNSTARFRVVDLLATIPSDHAVRILIPAMSDKDYDVQRETIKRLDEKQLYASHLDLLAAQLDSRNSTARFAAVRMIGKVGGDKAIELLKDRLVVETDYDVERELKKTIQSLSH
jgi:HEAT repeat protein